MVRRRLILLRHGDAASPEGVPDIGRALTSQGLEQSERMAVQLRDVGWLPEAALSSKALRAQQTMDRVLTSLGLELQPSILDSLYEGGVGEIQRALGTVAQAVATVLVVGHNPTFSAAASVFSGVRVSLSTANAALLEVEAGGWGEAAHLAASWTLVEHLRA